MSLNGRWVGKPSQLLNAPLYLFYMIVLVVAYPGAIWLASVSGINYEAFLAPTVLYSVGGLLWTFLKTYCHRFTIDPKLGRLIEETGVLNKHKDVLEIFRVKDQVVIKSLYKRVLGLGDVVVHTSDKTTPVIKLTGFKDPDSIEENIRFLADKFRTEKGVREFD